MPVAAPLIAGPTIRIEGGYMARIIAFTVLVALMMAALGCGGGSSSTPALSGWVANFQLHGSAAEQTGNVLRLTPATPSQVGSAWMKVQQPVAGGFTAEFQFRITDTNPPSGKFPADGIAFVIQNSDIAALGGMGGGIGYAGIPNSLAVEFDTHDNPGLPIPPGPDAGEDDPDGNHVGVQSCGNTQGNSADHAATYQVGQTNVPCNLGLAASPSLAGISLADGAVHTVKIDYASSTGTLQVTLDNNDLFTSTNSNAITGVNLGNLLNLGNGGTAWVGFTAATGAFVENNDILSWSFTPNTH
jgi:lectin family protein